jgi:glycosyltransferase involved in cell wall biosynthesis
LLLEAMLPVLHEYPETDLHLVGEDVPGDPAFNADMARLRTQLEVDGLSKRVIFYGYVPERELLMHYRSCDVFVAPSRFESFGLIAIEAMRFGKPVVASNAGGLGDIFRDDVDGLLFENEDVGSLSAALAKAAASKELRLHIGARGKETFLRKYTAELMASAAAKVFAKAAFPKDAPRLTVPARETLLLAAAGGR